MKKIKFLFLFVLIGLTVLYSCTDNNPVENGIVTSDSISLRTTLNKIKESTNVSGRAANDQALCFSFVFPINLSYNDGTIITVNSYEGLTEILMNETGELYIEGIEFPFQVQQEGINITINNEEDFFSLILGCGFQTINDFITDFDCYQIIFPISLINQNNENITVNSEEELIGLLTNPSNSNYQLDIVFPISVIKDNETIVINDLYEFFELNEDCVSSLCNCPTDYNPVCVQTPNGVVEFSNLCNAECAGYTQADLVSCDGLSPCAGIANLSVEVGDCNIDGTYALTIDFNHQNAPAAATHFVVHSSSGEIIGTYPLESLPLVIPNYPSTNSTTDYLSVEYGLNINCAATKYWVVPNCN